jgi:hypothetical protein
MSGEIQKNTPRTTATQEPIKGSILNEFKTVSEGLGLPEWDRIPTKFNQGFDLRIRSSAW